MILDRRFLAIVAAGLLAAGAALAFEAWAAADIAARLGEAL